MDTLTAPVAPFTCDEPHDPEAWLSDGFRVAGWYAASQRPWAMMTELHPRYDYCQHRDHYPLG